MWLIPTRNRPKLMQELIDAMERVDDVPECAVMQDACVYVGVKWPAHWHIHESATHLEMSGAIASLYGQHPDRSFYGMLDDHTRPVSPGWSKALEDAAGDWGIASACNDKPRYRAMNHHRIMRINNYAIGGKLARLLGWVWWTGCVHLYGDDVLEDLGHALGNFQHVKEAQFESLLLRDGSMKPDGNSRRMWRGENYLAHDRAAYLEWKRRDFPALVSRIRQEMERS